MTSNQIAYKEAKTREAALQETKRSNKAKEKLTKRGQDIDKRGQNIKAINDITGNILGVASKAAAAANDPSWYRAEPQLVKDVANISFHNPLGNSIGTMFSPLVNNTKATVPGIMVMRFMPTIGALSTDGKASTADIAAKSIYSYVRHANSGSRNYESVDLMMYLLATIQAYNYYAYMARCYSLLTTCKSENRYYVDAMLRASGLDPHDFRTHIADFRAYINSYAIRLNSLYIPKDLPMMTRQIWMNTHIFKDSKIKKSQEYMFLQRDFLVYDDVNGKLVVFPESVSADNYSKYAHDFGPSKAFKFDQIRNTGDLIINSLVQSEDAGIMGGDILKAYGEGQMAYASVIPEDYHIESVYNYEVLTQIHNALFAPLPTVGFNDDDRLHMFDISQTSINNVDFLTQGKPFYNTAEDAKAGTNPVGYGIPTTMGLTQQHFIDTPINTNNSILNFDYDEVTPDDVMVATRLQFVLDDNKYFTVGGGIASVQTGCVTAFGTEIAVDYSVVYLSPEGYVLHADNIGTIIDETGASVYSKMSVICTFDWHPRLFINGTNSVAAQFGFSDTANYTVISDETKRNLHYVAVLSELGVPKLGLTVRNR